MSAHHPLQVPDDSPMPPVPKLFVGREQELDILHKWATGEGPQQPVVITGPPGIGKTTLAAHFVRTLRSRGWRALWFNSFDSAKLELDELRRSVNDESVRFVIVLDDESDPQWIAMVSSVLESARIIVTTRDPHLSSLGQGLHLTGISTTEATEVLRTMVPRLDEKEALRLALRFSGNPSLLRLAANALTLEGVNVGPKELLALLSRQAAPEGKSAAQESLGRQAAALARVDYSDGVAALQRGEYNEAVNYLTRAVSGLTTSVGPRDPDTFSASAALGEALRLDGRVSDAVAVLEELLAGADAPLHLTDARLHTARLSLANAQRDAGLLEASRATLEGLVRTLLSTRGPEHPDSLAAMSSLAVVRFESGDVQSAAVLQGEVAERSVELFGSEHARSLAARGNLASMLAAAGHHEAALKLQIELAEASSRALGREHPDTLTTLSNLASTYSQLGRTTEAQELEEEVLRGRQQALGPDHPDTLAAMNNLAVTLMERGDQGDALKLAEQVTKGYRRQSVSNPGVAPYLLDSLVFLSATLRDSGSSAPAQDVLREAVSLYDQLPDQVKRSVSAWFASAVRSLELSEGD